MPPGCPEPAHCPRYNVKSQVKGPFAKYGERVSGVGVSGLSADIASDRSRMGHWCEEQRRLAKICGKSMQATSLRLAQRSRGIQSSSQAGRPASARCACSSERGPGEQNGFSERVPARYRCFARGVPWAIARGRRKTHGPWAHSQISPIRSADPTSYPRGSGLFFFWVEHVTEAGRRCRAELEGDSTLPHKPRRVVQQLPCGRRSKSPVPNTRMNQGVAPVSELLEMSAIDDVQALVGGGCSWPCRGWLSLARVMGPPCCQEDGTTWSCE
jgi:hypothetical protein